MNHLFRIAVFVSVAALATAQERPAKPEKPRPAVATPAPARAPEAPPAVTADTGAAGNNSTDLPAQVAAIFFGLLQKGQIDPAYEGLTKGSKIAERPEELKTLKQKTREATEVFGPIQSYEQVESKMVGTSLLRRTYLSLNKEFPLRWRFYFYRSDNLWRLIDLRVDDRVTGMFDEHEEPRGADAPK